MSNSLFLCLVYISLALACLLGLALMCSLLVEHIEARWLRSLRVRIPLSYWLYLICCYLVIGLGIEAIAEYLQLWHWRHPQYLWLHLLGFWLPSCCIVHFYLAHLSWHIRLLMAWPWLALLTCVHVWALNFLHYPLPWLTLLAHTTVYITLLSAALAVAINMAPTNSQLRSPSYPIKPAE